MFSFPEHAWNGAADLTLMGALRGHWRLAATWLAAAAPRDL